MKKPNLDESRRGNAGKGRKPGSKNKLPAGLKAMILGALEAAGGQDYLLEQAKENPGAFMSLLGKVLPSELALSGKVDLRAEQITRIEQVIIDRDPVTGKWTEHPGLPSSHSVTG